MISEISFLWRHNLVLYYSRPWYLLAGGAQNPVLHYTCTNDLFPLISDLRNMILKYTPLWNKRHIRNAAKNALIG